MGSGRGPLPGSDHAATARWIIRVERICGEYLESGHSALLCEDGG
jgi:hypothetical protein